MRINFKQQLSFALSFLLTLSISLFMGQPSKAQISLPQGFGQSDNVGPPSAVTRYGNLEIIPVESPLSGHKLFTIASPSIYNRSPDALENKQTVEQRAEEVGARLLLLLNRPMDPKTLVFDVSKLNNVKIIHARDARFTQPLVLMSVTEKDAEYNGIPVDELAEKWRDKLEKELRTGLENLPKDERRIRQILIWLVIFTGIVVGLKYSLSRQQKKLRWEKQGINLQNIPNEPINFQAEIPTTFVEETLAQKRDAFLQRLQQLFSLDRQLRALDFAQWLLFWLSILAWYGGGLWVATISPYLMGNQFKYVEIPIDLLGIWFFTGLLIRVSRYLIDQFTTSGKGHELADFIDLGDVQRRQLRASTIAGATKGLVTILLLTLGLLWALGAIGVPTASTVAILGVLALAISFGSRRLVEDLVNGFLILVEDQYAVGDVIDLGTVAGLVENLNLRVTQLRSGGGEMITIPNSKINEVKNLTRGWSRVNFSIDVAYQTDPDQALGLMREVAQELYNDSEWHDKIVSEPAVLGIDSVSHSGMTLTTWIQTAPAQHWAVGREFRLRVRRALAEKGIEIGTPRQTYSLESASAKVNGLQT